LGAGFGCAGGVKREIPDRPLPGIADMAPHPKVSFERHGRLPLGIHCVRKRVDHHRPTTEPLLELSATIEGFQLDHGNSFDFVALSRVGWRLSRASSPALDLCSDCHDYPRFRPKRKARTKRAISTSWRCRKLHMDHPPISIQHAFMHHF
jgi:hypothetical protein